MADIKVRIVREDADGVIKEEEIITVPTTQISFDLYDELVAYSKISPVGKKYPHVGTTPDDR